MPQTRRAKQAGNAALDRLRASIEAAENALKDLQGEVSRDSRDLLKDIGKTLKATQRNLTRSRRRIAKDIEHLEHALVKGKAPARPQRAPRAHRARPPRAKPPAPNARPNGRQANARPPNGRRPNGRRPNGPQPNGPPPNGPPNGPRPKGRRKQPQCAEPACPVARARVWRLGPGSSRRWWSGLRARCARSPCGRRACWTPARGRTLC